MEVIVPVWFVYVQIFPSCVFNRRDNHTGGCLIGKPMVGDVYFLTRHGVKDYSSNVKNRIFFCAGLWLTPSSGVIGRVNRIPWPELLIDADNSNNMKNISILTMALLAAVMTSCEVVGDIFSAGFYIGGFVVVLVVGTILVLVLRSRK
jgi:hypothetical protein